MSREDEIRERWCGPERPAERMALALGAQSPRADVVYLLDRIAELEAELAVERDHAAMACETPADGCGCAGCRYADERGGAS
jgi:hypothetical protein